MTDAERLTQVEVQVAQLRVDVDKLVASLDLLKKALDKTINVIGAQVQRENLKRGLRPGNVGV